MNPEYENHPTHVQRGNEVCNDSKLGDTPEYRGQWHKLCVMTNFDQFPHTWKQVLCLIRMDNLVALKLHS
jgi:hypothetical protein